mmetsp:Transcript_55265/g.87628  ORF Transcript_55265/g.87628 Transcript_55265/m.87628 type:complete len:124 (+) Transcript_55265:199-570(+)
MLHPNFKPCWSCVIVVLKTSIVCGAKPRTPVSVLIIKPSSANFTADTASLNPDDASACTFDPATVMAVTAECRAAPAFDPAANVLIMRVTHANTIAITVTIAKMNIAIFPADRFNVPRILAGK